jgi:hypothetical protein
VTITGLLFRRRLHPLDDHVVNLAAQAVQRNQHLQHRNDDAARSTAASTDQTVSKRTKSGSPALLLPDGEKLCLPVFAKGDPEIFE